MKIFHLPDLGEGLAEAEINEWYIKVGDIVQVDQPMVSMETAKAVVDVPAPQAGKITKLYGKKGDIIPTHAPLVEFEGGEEAVRKDKGTVVGNLEESTTLLEESNIIIGAATTQAAGVKVMPAVRALAQQLKVDLTTLTPSGPRGQITLDDVKNAAVQSAPRLTGNVEALHGVRRAMAAAMTQSHQEVVGVTVVEDADVTGATRRTDLTSILIQAMVAGVQAEPALNAWYDGKNKERCLHEKINLGLAMDSHEGLFVPVLKDVAGKTISELRSMIDNFKRAVRGRTIPPSDLHGATISLTNFGTIAGRYANPVIVLPMVAILGCGKLRDEVKMHAGNIEVRRIMPLSLTFDHRAVTGGEATRFLATVIKYLEQHRPEG